MIFMFESCEEQHLSLIFCVLQNYLGTNGAWSVWLIRNILFYVYLVDDDREQ